MPSRNLPSKLVTLIKENSVDPVLLFEFDYDSGTQRYWTGFGSIAHNGNTYQGSGQAITMDPVEETDEVKASGTKLVLSGVPEDIISTALDENWKNRPARVHLGFLTEHQAIAGTITLYEGRMDKKDLVDQIENLGVEINLEHELVDLKRPRERRWTNQDQKIDYEHDDFFEFTPTIQDKPLPWGKPSA